jgi:hypothetical protein
MFWAFKLSFGVDILVFWATFFKNLGKNLFYFLVTLDEVNVHVGHEVLMEVDDYVSQIVDFKHAAQVSPNPLVKYNYYDINQI